MFTLSLGSGFQATQNSHCFMQDLNSCEDTENIAL
jgi:hypothetical protein